MKAKKIFIFVGNPDHDSLSTALAESYAKGAKSAGHEVRFTHIADMKFDPILHHGYKVKQTYESDLLKFQEDVIWCEHFVSVFPIWWSSLPALMKGLIDRVWMPGFAYNFWKGTIPGWTRKLKGRSARVIITSNTPSLLLKILFGTGANEWTRATLRFSGFGPLRRTWFSGMKNLTPERSQRMLAKTEKLGRRAK